MNKKKETLYRLRKENKELQGALQKSNSSLCMYKSVCSDINDGLRSVMAKQEHISHSWLIGQFRRLWR